MMFDFSMSELLVVAIVALLVIGPRDLPRTLYALGRWIGKARSLVSEFHHYVDDVIHEAELEEFRQKAEMLNHKTLAQVLENTVNRDDDVYCPSDSCEVEVPRRLLETSVQGSRDGVRSGVSSSFAVSPATMPTLPSSSSQLSHQPPDLGGIKHCVLAL